MKTPLYIFTITTCLCFSACDNEEDADKTLSGSDDNPIIVTDGGNNNLEGIENAINIAAKETAILDLADTQTLISYTDRINPSDTDTATFTHQGNSNLLALTEDNSPFQPFNNIEPIKVNYIETKPDNSSIYLHVSNDSTFSSYSRSLAEDVKLNDEAQQPQWRTPLIGAPLDFDFPLSKGQLRNELGPNADYSYGYTLPLQGACPEDSFLTPLPKNPSIDICLQFISYTNTDGETKTVLITPFIQSVQDLFDTQYFFCSLLEYKKDDGSLHCAAGSQKLPGSVKVAGIKVPVQVTIPLVEPTENNLEAFNRIRENLTPLQFDSLGQHYVVTDDPTGNFSRIHQFDSDNSLLNTIIPSEQDQITSYVILNNDKIVYSFQSYSDTGVDKGLKFFHNNVTHDISSSSQFRNNYQADWGGNLMIKSHLLSVSDQGVSQSPLSWQSYLASETHLTEQSLIGCVKDKLVRISPYEKTPLYEHCSFAKISHQYGLTVDNASNGKMLSVVNFNNSEKISLINESNGIDALLFRDSTLWVSGLNTASSPFLHTFNLTASDPVASLNDIPVVDFINANNTVMQISPISAGNATDAPKVIDVQASPLQRNQITVSFDQAMNGSSLNQDTLTLERGETEQNANLLTGSHFASFLPVNTDANAINQKVGAYSPHFFDTESPYKITFDTSTITNLHGNELSGDTPTPAFTFMPENAFYWAASETADNHSLHFRAASRSTIKSLTLPRGDDSDFWQAYGDITSTDMFRYFKLTDYRHGASYELHFSLLNRDPKHRLGIAVSQKDAELITDPAEVTSERIWQWPEENDSAITRQGAPVYGFSLSGKESYSYPSYDSTSNNLLDNSDDVSKQFQWQAFKLTITNNTVDLAIKNTEGNFDSLGSQALPAIDNETLMSLWLAFPHFSSHELDNILFTKESQNTPVIDTDFEDEATAFDQVPHLKKVHTQAITPL